MTNDLLMLETSLTRGFVESLRSPQTWSDNANMKMALLSVRAAFDSAALPISDRRVATAVSEFRKTRRIGNFTALKYVCLGSAEIADQWCVLCEPELRDTLLSSAASGSLRVRKKCFQYLLRAYFSFARYDEQTPQAALAGWRALRHWLSHEFAALRQALAESPTATLPGWWRVLERHTKLLEVAAGEAFRIDGPESIFREIRTKLAIPYESWLWEEVALARVNYAIQAADTPFRESLDKTIASLFCDPELKLSQRLAALCVGRLVSRYAQCKSRPESQPLRDAALTAIGNPWLRRQAWNAYVRDEAGEPDEAARGLVLSWLRRDLIKDFFELLTEDRAADTRRLQYWLRFEPAIEDMWFILGNQTGRSTHSEYEGFRKRAQGRVLRLSGQTTAGNNAFIMRVGNSLVVEFGLINNACFLFAWNQLPRQVRGKLTLGADHLEVEIDKLRVGERLIHRDSPRAAESWESKFDQVVTAHFGFIPAPGVRNPSDRAGEK